MLASRTAVSQLIVETVNAALAQAYDLAITSFIAAI
jgi:hypothetical protein